MIARSDGRDELHDHGDELVARLARHETPTVSDALDRLGLTGAAPGLKPMTVGGRLAGRVQTVQLRRDRGGRPDRHLGTAAIEAAGPGDVIAVDNGGRTDSSAWGGLLAMAARVRGAIGAIVDGACRDVDQIANLRWPVYAAATTPLGARGRVREIATGTRIRIVDADVEPGDLVLADAGGVVFVPRARAAEILDVADEIAAYERSLEAALRDGAGAASVLCGEYERLLERPK